MSERQPIPLENRLGLLQRGDDITVVTSSFGSDKLKFQDGIFLEVRRRPDLPTILNTLLVQGPAFPHSISDVFAGSCRGIDSVIAYEDNNHDKPYVAFHNSNMPRPYLRPFRNSLGTLKGVAENIDRKVKLGLGSRQEITEERPVY